MLPQDTTKITFPVERACIVENPIESVEKNFIERSNFKAGLARRRPINRKLGQEEQAQVVKQTQIGSKWSHIVSQKVKMQ